MNQRVAVAMFLTAIQRKLLSHDVPVFAVDAPERSTGKTVLVRLIAQLATGRVAAAHSWPHDDEEMAKALLAILSEGHGIVCFDDCTTIR